MHKCDEDLIAGAVCGQKTEKQISSESAGAPRAYLEQTACVADEEERKAYQ